jgi:hypothetical protein
MPSTLNPSGKYPRRYVKGHFLHLAQRYYRRTWQPDRPAQVLFMAVFSNSTVRSVVKAISGHGLWPILIATGVTISGHSAMLIRSVALLVCAIWLSVDIAIWIAEKKWPLYLKSMALSAAMTGSCCLAMGIMYWFLLSTLEDQQSNVDANLIGSVFLPPGGDVWLSHFSVTNKSNWRLRYLITCAPKMIVDEDQSTFTGAGWAMSEPSWLEAGGDTDSSQCLSTIRIGNKNAILCADVELDVLYALETQMVGQKHKRFRFVGYREANKFEWFPKGLDYAGTSCSQFMPHPAP